VDWSRPSFGAGWKKLGGVKSQTVRTIESGRHSAVGGVQGFLSGAGKRKRDLENRFREGATFERWKRKKY